MMIPDFDFSGFLVRLGIILLIIVGVSMYIVSSVSYDRGFERGGDLMLDTLNKIVKRHVDDTNNVAEVHFEMPKDTIVYHMSSKKIK